MRFDTIQQIASYYGLETTDADEMRVELQRIRIELHPDRTGGEFPSEEDKQRYLDVTTALDFLDSIRVARQSLVPQNIVLDLTNSVRDLAIERSRADREMRLSTQIDNRISKIRTSHFFPKAMATSITALLTALWVFPSAVGTHPVLSSFVDTGNPQFAAAWIGSIFLTVFVWLFYQLLENRYTQFQLRLKTESFQNRLFREFREYLALDMNQTAFADGFTKEDFAEYLMNKRPSSGASALGLNPRQIDLDVAQQLAEMIFERAVKANVIRSSTTAKMSEYFNITNPNDTKG